MDRQPVSLHPSMTANQIAAWCAQHRMIVCIEYLRSDQAQVVPVIRAYPIDPPVDLPAFLRQQAE